MVNATPPVALLRGKRPGTHCVGGRVGARAGLDGCGKSSPPLHRDSIPGPSCPYRVTIPTELSRPKVAVILGLNTPECNSTDVYSRRLTDQILHTILVNFGA
jgi:hypothetical protein